MFPHGQNVASTQILGLAHPIMRKCRKCLWIMDVQARIMESYLSVSCVTSCARNCVFGPGHIYYAMIGLVIISYHSSIHVVCKTASMGRRRGSDSGSIRLSHWVAHMYSLEIGISPPLQMRTF
jgi:hypothetical protein